MSAATARRVGPVGRAALMRRRRKRTLRVLGVLLVSLLLVGFSRVVDTMSRSNVTPPVEYVVLPGDTLWEIATQHNNGGDVRKLIYTIKQTNGLQNSTVQPGQVLLIPQPIKP